MTMEISEEKMKDIRTELQVWLTRTQANRREVESLIGKLQFMAKCIRAGRIFISRLINWIKGMERDRKYSIPQEARKDIVWWGRCAESHNGVSIMWMMKEPNVDSLIASDASKKGYGATFGTQYLRGRFPREYMDKNIALLELLAVVVAIKAWGPSLVGRYFWIHVDNQAVATVLNTGASRDIELQDALREMSLLAAQYQFVIKAKHIPGVDNRVPDWLSRWSQPESKKRFNQHIRDKGWVRTHVSGQLLKHKFNW